MKFFATGTFMQGPLNFKNTAMRPVYFRPKTWIFPAVLRPSYLGQVFNLCIDTRPASSEFYCQPVQFISVWTYKEIQPINQGHMIKCGRDRVPCFRFCRLAYSFGSVFPLWTDVSGYPKRVY